MNIFILRHGDTENVCVGQKDFGRKLSENGVLEAVKIGDYLKELNIDQIICSSAVRAVETQAIVNEFVKTDHVDFYDNLYLASFETIINSINMNAFGENVLYIGHNFGISDFASHLCDHEILMSTCMLIELEVLVDEWRLLSTNTGLLKTITEPNKL